MCEPKCFESLGLWRSFIIYIIIEYSLMFICVLIYRREYWNIFIITSYVFVTIMMYLVCCILYWSQKIPSTYFYFTIQIGQLFVFLLEIEHRWYELLFVTPLIFYFLLFLPYNGLIKIKSHQEEEENNSDLYITRLGGETLPLPYPRTFQRQSFPLSTSVTDLPSIELDLFNMNNATSSVSSQPPTYDEVMKKDSKVIIHIESDPEPPSYSEALVGEKCFPVVSV